MTTERMKLANMIEAALDVEVATTDRQLRNLLREAAAALRTPEADAGAVAWHHKKSGHIVTEIGRGKVQAATPVCEMQDVVVYEHDGNIWVRAVSEFEDGRFEKIAAPTAAGIAAPQGTREALSADLEKVQCELDAAELRIKELEAAASPAASADAVRADKIDAAMKWPAGCHSANSCDRHQQCMYANCRYEGKDIKPDIATAKAALTVPVADADAGMRTDDPFVEAMKEEAEKWPSKLFT